MTGVSAERRSGNRENAETAGFSVRPIGRPNCAGTPGTETQFAENIDKSLANYTGGGTLGQPLTQIDPAKLPLRLANGACTPVYPHQFIQVNTLFEVIRSYGGHTAWSDKHPAYDILNGPSGQGIEDLFTPEINSQLPGAPAGQDYTTSFSGIQSYDGLKVRAILNEIDGEDSTGTVYNNDVPWIFGMNFQAVSVGQKLATAAYGDDRRSWAAMSTPAGRRATA